MRTTWFTLGVGALLTMGALQAAFDGTIKVGDTALNIDPSNDAAQILKGAGGGLFKVTVQTGLGGLIVDGAKSFLTFCLERDEYIDLGDSVYDVNLNSQALKGGVNTDSGDPISVGTAWLYSQFRGGNLVVDTAEKAGFLQAMIWYLEGEVGGIDVNNPYDNLLTTEFGSLDAANDDAAVGQYGVVVLNVSLGQEYIQDFLGIVPEPTTVLAGALLLLPFGLSAVRVLRRKQVV